MQGSFLWGMEIISGFHTLYVLMLCLLLSLSPRFRSGLFSATEDKGQQYNIDARDGDNMIIIPY